MYHKGRSDFSVHEGCNYRYGTRQKLEQLRISHGGNGVGIVYNRHC
jgi:hypothetical protein